MKPGRRGYTWDMLPPEYVLVADLSGRAATNLPLNSPVNITNLLKDGSDHCRLTGRLSPRAVFRQMSGNRDYMPMSAFGGNSEVKYSL
jgi:hypothetical protein